MKFAPIKTTKPEINEQPRPINSKQPRTPATELWHQLRCQRLELAARRDEIEEVIKTLAPVLFDLFRLSSPSNIKGQTDGDTPLKERLNLLRQEMESALKKKEISMEIFDNRKWTSVESNEATLMNYLEHPDQKEQIVTETIAPLVKYKGRVIQIARVVVSGPPKEFL